MTGTTGSPRFETVLAGLVLTPTGVDSYVAHSPHGLMKNVFGGQVIAQALIAAGLTVDFPARQPHSLHAYFVRGGDASRPIELRVWRDLDGRSFSMRRVVASQGGDTILNFAASFHVRQRGIEHATIMPDVAPPESLADDRWLAGWGDARSDGPGARERDARDRGARDAGGVILTRTVPDRDGTGSHRIWMRPVGDIGPDPLLHCAMLGYVSDFGFLYAAMQGHGLRFSDAGLKVTSLDHALWLHRGFVWDDWILFDKHSPWATGARALVQGSLFARDGGLIGTVAQEGLIRSAALNP